MAGFLYSAMLVLPLAGGEPMVGNPAGVLIRIMSILFGTPLGRMIHDGARLDQVTDGGPPAD